MWILALVAAVCLRNVHACGQLGDECCNGDCEDVDHFCDAGVCVVALPGEGLCDGKGMLGQPCCMRICSGQNITCAEGTCVNINEDPVLDQSGPLPGSVGGACIGDDLLCDEDDDLVLECIDRVCVEQFAVLDQSAMATCGALNQDCCYGLEEELCTAGPCDPGFPRPDPNDFKAFPCLCSSTVCVRNIQYCAPDQICDQSSDVPDCGGLGEPCCDGINCNEDIEDDNGNFYDLLCIPADGEGKQVNVCARPEEPVLEQSFGCGGLGEKCCRDGACNGSGLCSFGVCTHLSDGSLCSRPGDACCDGAICDSQFLTCDTDDDSMFEQLCVRCGSEGQPCCKDSNTVYCAGSNMECSKGVCMVAPGPCDQIGKACCSNSATNVQYCSSEVDRLTCNVLVEGEDTAKCEHCGGANEPCCFPNSVDANSAAARDLAGAFPACQSDEQACMLDAGSADFFGKCVDCGQEEGAPCCWARQSTLETSVANTTQDIMVPRCPAAGLACQEFLAMDDRSFKDVQSFYRCMPEAPDVLGQPRAFPGACGSFGQPCCGTGDLGTRCGSGLACNLDSSRCEECGHEDQLCCPALVPEMKHGVCSMGMGCTNNVQLISERKCKPCGEKNAPCCWDLQTGYTCNDELRCSGTIGGVTLMR